MRINASDFGFKFEVPNYVNEHLCPELKKVMGQASTKKQENGWEFL